MQQGSVALVGVAGAVGLASVERELSKHTGLHPPGHLALTQSMSTSSQTMLQQAFWRGGG